MATWVLKSSQRILILVVVKHWKLQERLEFVYAFLDTEERKRFAAFEHEYLITQVNRQNSSIGVTSSDHSFKISSNNPTQYGIVVVPKRDDQAALNQWNNYIHWIDNPTSILNGI